MTGRPVTGRALCCAVLVLVAGCGGTETVTVTKTVTAAGTELSVHFGYIKSLTKEGPDYELRFDPALFLGGETANAAAAEDGAVEPGQPVPNDHYVVDEGHRLLTFRVPADTAVTVLAESPEGTPVTVAELAEIVAGNHKPLWEPIRTGFWLTADVDTVISLDQQYRP